MVLSIDDAEVASPESLDGTKRVIKMIPEDLNLYPEHVVAYIETMLEEIHMKEDDIIDDDMALNMYHEYKATAMAALDITEADFSGIWTALEVARQQRLEDCDG